MAPQQLYQHYTTPWTNWNTVVAVNSYGNTPALLQAINSGINSVAGLEALALAKHHAIRSTQTWSAPSRQIVAAQGATSDLSVGIMQANLQTLGPCARILNSAPQISRSSNRRRTRATLHNRPNMATIQRINEATPDAVAQPARRDQIAQAVALQQIVHRSSNRTR